MSAPSWQPCMPYGYTFNTVGSMIVGGGYNESITIMLAAVCPRQSPKDSRSVGSTAFVAA